MFFVVSCRQGKTGALKDKLLMVIENIELEFPKIPAGI